MLQQDTRPDEENKSFFFLFRLWELQQDLAMKFSSYLTRSRHSCKMTRASSLSAAASRYCCSFSYMNCFLPLSFSRDHCSLLLLSLPLLLPVINHWLRGQMGFAKRKTIIRVKDVVVLTDIWFKSNNGTLFLGLVLVSSWILPEWFKSGSVVPCFVSATLVFLLGDTFIRICVWVLFPSFDLPLTFFMSCGWSCLKCRYLRRRNLINDINTWEKNEHQGLEYFQGL